MRNRNSKKKKCFIYEILLTLRNLKGEAAERWKQQFEGYGEHFTEMEIRFTVEIKRKFFFFLSF